MSCAWFTDYGRLCYREPAGFSDGPNFPEDSPRIRLCPQHLRSATEWFVPPDLPHIRYEERFVYFLWNRSAHQIKIGRSTDPKIRIRQLQSQCGLEFETLLVLPETSELTEKLLHGRVDAYRKHGTEWFESSPAMFDWIEQLRKYGEDEAALRSASVDEWLEEVSDES